MTVTELEKEIEYVIEQIQERGLDPSKIVVSMQIDHTNSCTVASSYSTHEINIMWDDNGIASGCVLYGWSEESEEK